MNHFVVSIEDGELKHIQKLTEDEFIASREKYRKLKEIEKEWEKAKKYVDPYEFAKLTVRYWQENVIQYHGDPIDWAVYSITRFLNDYLKEKGVDENTSLTDKRMFTIGFAHRVEEGLLDYLEKLEEFNS